MPRASDAKFIHDSILGSSECYSLVPISKPHFRSSKGSSPSGYERVSSESSARAKTGDGNEPSLGSVLSLARLHSAESFLFCSGRWWKGIALTF